jgi:hypothetical protein
LPGAFGAELDDLPSGDQSEAWTRRAHDVVRERTAVRGQQPLWQPDESGVEELGRRFHEVAREVLRLRSPALRSTGVRIEVLREQFDPPLERAADELERCYLDFLDEIVGILWLLSADRVILEDDVRRNGFDPTKGSPRPLRAGEGLLRGGDVRDAATATGASRHLR